MSNISPPTLTSPVPIPNLVPHQQTATSAKPIRICVFCSTQTGRNPSSNNTSLLTDPTDPSLPPPPPPKPSPAVLAATELAQALHARNVHLIYGGGSTGLMGTVARERVRLGGPDTVLGVIPYALVDSERAGLEREGIPQLFGTEEGKAGGKAGRTRSEDRRGRNVGAGLEGATAKVKQIFARKKNQSQDLGVAGAGASEAQTGGNGDVSQSATTATATAAAASVGAPVPDTTDHAVPDPSAPSSSSTTDQENPTSQPKETWQTWTDVYTLPTDPLYGRVVGTPSLNQRKAVMMDAVKHGAAGSGFIALPGGFGSLDEVLAVLTARQLGQHKQSIVLVNVDGFWSALERWMDEAVEKGFLGAESRGFVRVVGSVEEGVKWLVEGGEFRV